VVSSIRFLKEVGIILYGGQFMSRVELTSGGQLTSGGELMVETEEHFKMKIISMQEALAKLKDPNVFDLSTTPKRIYERKELQNISDLMAKYNVFGIPNNIIIYGPRGSGKTISILFFLNILKKYNIKTFYVKARECPSSYTIYQKMTNTQKFGYHPIELRERALNEFKEKSVIVIDEADFLEDFEILYHFSRSTKASIILLAQNIQFGKRIDEATYSSLLPSKIYFSEYDAEALYQILKMRAEDGLYKWNDTTLRLIAAIVSRDYHGDARIAIRALFNVAITDAWHDEEKVKNAIIEASREIDIMSLKELKETDLIALFVVSKIKETNKAYEIFNNYMNKIHHRPLSKPAFFRILNYLQNLGLITQIRKKVGKYYTTEIDLLIDEKAIEEEIATKFSELLT
jgi:cell division control protein 6